ncbi:MAG: ferredoxin--NADP reductase [Candidatus Hodarchaeales archaeon]|jgi:ferredoxin-NADP reductase
MGEERSKKRKRKPQQVAKIIKVVKETKDTSTLRLLLPDPFDWDLGQFILVSAEIRGITVKRAYSISSSPTRDYLEITVRQTDTPTMSKFLNERVEGDELVIRGPYGRFTWTENISSEVFCIGAGSGITPFRAFFEYFIDKQLENQIKLLYSCSYGDNVIFESQLRELVREIKNCEYELTITRDPRNLKPVRRGRINKEYLVEEKKGYEEARFYLCGSPNFVKAMIDYLVDHEIPRERIKREQWG